MVDGRGGSERDRNKRRAAGASDRIGGVRIFRSGHPSSARAPTLAAGSERGRSARHAVPWMWPRESPVRGLAALDTEVLATLSLTFAEASREILFVPMLQ